MSKEQAKAWTPTLNRPACNPNLWLLDSGITYLNHGSFGACPRAVLKFQQAWQARLEQQPMRFFVRAVVRFCRPWGPRIFLPCWASRAKCPWM